MTFHPFPARRCLRLLLALGSTVFLASDLLAAEPDPSRPLEQRFAAGENATETVSFRRHVVPLLARSGCSGRACHGSFQGKGGMRLSLFGYDFKEDHSALTGSDEPRVDSDDPSESLILLKPTMQEKHGGKEIFATDSWQYRLLSRWIAQGATDDSSGADSFSRLEIRPSAIDFRTENEAVQLKVFAHWNSGRVEDVTALARFQTRDESIATVSASGRVASVNRGDTHVVVFYDNGVEPIPVLRPVSKFYGEHHPPQESRSDIDRLIAAQHRRLGILPSAICDDAEYLRRLSIDLAGTLPTPDEIRSFLADRRPDKRSRKIDELLETPQYAAWWTTKLCDLTGNSERQIGEKLFASEMSRQWYDWIYRRIEGNVSYDRIAAGIILGSSRETSDESYTKYTRQMSAYFREKNPRDFASRETMPHYWSRKNMRKPEEKALSISHAFLGVRIQCAQCHKHPFDQWTKDDFAQFQAFFEPVQYGFGRDERNVAKKFELNIQSSLGVMMNKPGAKPEEKAKMKKMVYEETKRLVAQGKPVPWKEVYVRPTKVLNEKQRKQRKKRKKPGKAFSGRVLTPKLLGDEEVKLSDYDDPREPLVEWLRTEKNPYFARAFVNRVWAHHFGRGIVEPADDMNLANPPSNKNLLEHLERRFVASGYDIKALHREILASDAYQRSWKSGPTNALDEKHFSRRILRRMPAEVYVDAMTTATASAETVVNFVQNVEERAIGPRSADSRKRGVGYAMSIFGKPLRETNCDCERSDDPSLIQTIYTLNDPDVWTLLDRKDGWIYQLSALDRDRQRESIKKKRNEAKKRREQRKKKARGKNRRQDKDSEDTPQPGPQASAPERPSPDASPIIQEAYLRVLSRPPSAVELMQAQADFKAAQTTVSGLRDLLWVLLNTKEFAINH